MPIRPAVAALLSLALALSLTSAAAAYPWPLTSLDEQHPIRATFGEPRTLFELPPGDVGLNGPGSFSFNDGVDIAVQGAQPVYSVEPGVAEIVADDAVVLTTADGRSFEYSRIAPSVRNGQVVGARTQIGTAIGSASYIHFAERNNGTLVNPLEPGHLTPFADRTRPRIRAVVVRNSLGRRISPLELCGTISLAADAFDTQPLRVEGIWSGLPVAPAVVSWTLLRLATGAIVARGTTADFLAGLPPDGDFWRVYARGTYQNMPQFGQLRLTSFPGRFLYSLTPDGLDTRRFANGPFELTVTATDSQGNSGSLVRRLTILNFSNADGPRPCPRTTRGRLPARFWERR